MNLRSFGKNAIVYSIGTTALRASAFLLIPIYTHFLSLKDYGLLATLLLTSHFMITIIDLGVRSGLMRFFAEFSRENKLKYLMGSLFTINLSSGIVVLLISMFLLKPLFISVLHTEDVNDYILLAALAALIQSVSINITSYYRAKHQGMQYMIMNLAVAALLILLNIILFIALDAGIKGALLAYIFSYGAIGIIAAALVFKQTGFGISGKVVVDMFKYCAPLIFATGGFAAMETTAAYFLSIFASLESVGIYNLAYKLAQIGSMIIVLPFQLAYEPFLFANLERPDIKNIVGRLTTYVLLAFTIVAFTITFAFRDLITVISPPEYFSAYYIIFLLLPGMAFSGIFYIGQSLLHAKNRTHITGSTVAVFTILSVLLNYFLIQYWQMGGLLLVYNGIWIFVSLLMMRSGLKSFPVNLQKKRLVIVSFTFVFLLSFIYLMHDTSSYLYYTLIPAVFLLTVASYYYGGFVDEKEKSIISRYLGKAGLLLKKTKVNEVSNS